MILGYVQGVGSMEGMTAWADLQGDGIDMDCSSECMICEYLYTHYTRVLIVDPESLFTGIRYAGLKILFSITDTRMMPSELAITS